MILKTHFASPAALAAHGIGPTLAATSEVLPLADQALMQLAGERRDAAHPGVMTKPMAGHTDLAAAAGAQHRIVQIGPRLNGLQANRQTILQASTHVLAQISDDDGLRPFRARAGNHLRRVCAAGRLLPARVAAPGSPGHGRWSRSPAAPGVLRALRAGDAHAAAGPGIRGPQRRPVR